ncbi:HAD-IA family hydrolase [Fictibacillus sp. UD]|uniref:HAD family hydrolase n=1 Tax=Fictibacillus sp. UD TaxID=3038777 RepID=UPI003746C848
MKKYKLLLFDLDDTLLNSDWFKIGLIQTLGIHPITKDLDASLFLAQKLQVSSHLIALLKKRLITPLNFRRARWRHAFSHFGLTIDDKQIDELDTLFVKTGLLCIEQSPTLITMLHELKAHYELAIVTNALYDPRQKVQQMGLSEVFSPESIFHGEELGLRKPDRELYYAPLEQFDHRPEQTLFIGDSWTHDIAGPIDFGMDAIWINARGSKPLTEHKPFAIVSDVMEIREILLYGEHATPFNS